MTDTKESVVNKLRQESDLFVSWITALHQELVREQIITPRQNRDIQNYILHKWNQAENRKGKNNGTN